MASFWLSGKAVPETLFDQLADGGRLIAPVGWAKTAIDPIHS